MRRILFASLLLVSASATAPAATVPPLGGERAAATFTVTASLTDDVVEVGDSTVLRGRVRPVRTGTKVLVQRRNADGWVTVARRAMTSEGRYRHTIAATRAGTFRYRAKMPRVGSIRSDVSPVRTLTVTEPVEDGVVTFTIESGTGASSWNTQATQVVAEVGDVLRITNADFVPHQLHTDGVPFPHAPSPIAPGGSADYPIQAAFTGSLYCHTHGQTSLFWITVTDPAG